MFYYFCKYNKVDLYFEKVKKKLGKFNVPNYLNHGTLNYTCCKFTKVHNQTDTFGKYEVSYTLLGI